MQMQDGQAEDSPIVMILEEAGALILKIWVVVFLISLKCFSVAALTSVFPLDLISRIILEEGEQGHLPGERHRVHRLLDCGGRR